MGSQQAYPSNGQYSSQQEYYGDNESTFTISHYAKEMFDHTKKQMDAATRLAARRRSPNANGTNAHGTLSNEQGSISSVDSRESR